MSFHLSAEDIRIDDNHILRARLRNENGDWEDAEIDLNEHIGNEDGMIHWDGVSTYNLWKKKKHLCFPIVIV